MNPRLTILPGPEPDDIDLDLLALGAAVSTADRARIEAARAGPLAEADAELADARARFAEHARPLRSEAPEPVRSAKPSAEQATKSTAGRDRDRPDLAVTEPPRLRSKRWRLVPLVALAVAALVLGWLGRPSPDNGVRAMGGGLLAEPGGLAVQLVVRRGGQIHYGPDLRANDELHVRVQSPRDGYLDVWTRQDDGSVSQLVVGEPVAAGRSIELPGAIRLDGYEGEEWLVVRVGAVPSDPDDPAAWGPDDLEPASSWALEVTRQPR